ncbi:hypothetical protein ACQFX9_03435 [Aliinostoc sp. HNIBRCY26]|uniref:hypothetical protein n=1 Tax=Aliinostoc sp. HNIBRCY26 TaxID=3418997 RepID=UPI003D04BF94
MSRLLIKAVGLILLLTGIYFLAQNVIFFSGYYSFSQRLPTTASVLSMMAGALSLIFFRRETGNLGWVLLAVGFVLVFLSGGIFFKSISLWNLFLAFAAMAGGWKLFSGGRIDF